MIYLTRNGWARLLPVTWPAKMSRPSVWATPAAVWIGALTHLGWDSWTHADGYFVELWPWLPFKLLQHGSTVAGTIGLAFLLWPKLNLAARPIAPLLLF